MEQKNTKRSFLADSSIYLTGTSVSAIVPILILPIITRYLTPSDYGIYAIFILFGSVTSGLLSFGLKAATYRFYFEYQQLGDYRGFRIINSSSLYFISILFFVFGIFCIFNSKWISDYFFENKCSLI